MTSSDGADAARLQALTECLHGRRSIKLFEDRPVEREKLLAAVDAARWAPNHHVTEPWHFYLLGERATGSLIELVRAVTTEMRSEEVAARKAERWSQIPAWVVVTCAVADDELTRLEDYAACCCAIQNFALYLWAAGIGIKWSTGPVTRDKRFYEMFGMDHEQETVIGLISCGYPKTVPVQKRRPVEDIVTALD